MNLNGFFENVGKNTLRILRFWSHVSRKRLLSIIIHHLKKNRNQASCFKLQSQITVERNENFTEDQKNAFLPTRRDFRPNK